MYTKVPELGGAWALSCLVMGPKKAQRKWRIGPCLVDMWDTHLESVPSVKVQNGSKKADMGQVSLLCGSQMLLSCVVAAGASFMNYNDRQMLVSSLKLEEPDCGRCCLQTGFVLTLCIPYTSILGLDGDYLLKDPTSLVNHKPHSSTEDDICEALKPLYVAIPLLTTWGKNIFWLDKTGSPVSGSGDGLAHPGLPLCCTRGGLRRVLCQGLTKRQHPHPGWSPNRKWVFDAVPWLTTRCWLQKRANPHWPPC